MKIFNALAILATAGLTVLIPYNMYEAHLHVLDIAMVALWGAQIVVRRLAELLEES